MTHAFTVTLTQKMVGTFMGVRHMWEKDKKDKRHADCSQQSHLQVHTIQHTFIVTACGKRSNNTSINCVVIFIILFK